LGETGNIAMLGLMLVVMSGLLFFGKSYFAGAGNARGIRDGGHPIEPASVKREITGPQADRPWTNSLGMSFVPVAGTGVLFSVWDTRVQDFEAFVLATRHDAAAGMWSLGRDGWKQRGDTWRSPGFVQGPAHPVCGVSWDDARAFCAWLTRKEQAAGEIGPEQSYRLPTDAEWSAAVGDGLYPWGSQWPPPAGAGNYAGAEAADENWPVKYTTIAEYRDGYARTSPVGSFNANQYGLYDMGGNLWQWCEDWYRKELNRDDVRKQKPALDDDGGGQMYRVLRGGSGHIGTPLYMRSDCRYGSGPGNRNDVIGFRCVLASIKAEAV
jgi:formylglycine-generating enzyme required for sulfatase activity